MTMIGRRATLALPGLLLPASLRAQGATGAPAGYPQGYQEVVAGAEREGSLLVYSIMSAENWRPVLEGFNRRYPKVKMETLDLPNSREVFERYLAERGTNSRTADLLATADPSGWIEFRQRGEVMPYESPEIAAWPAWSPRARAPRRCHPARPGGQHRPRRQAGGAAAGWRPPWCGCGAGRARISWCASTSRSRMPCATWRRRSFPVAAIMVTKVEGADHLRLLDELVSRLEQARGLPAGGYSVSQCALPRSTVMATVSPTSCSRGTPLKGMSTSTSASPTRTP